MFTSVSLASLGKSKGDCTQRQKNHDYQCCDQAPQPAGNSSLLVGSLFLLASASFSCGATLALYMGGAPTQNCRRQHVVKNLVAGSRWLVDWRIHGPQNTQITMRQLFEHTHNLCLVEFSLLCQVGGRVGDLRP